MSATLDWVSVRSALPINTVGGQVTVPAFDYACVWHDASEIVVQYGFSSSRNFIVPRSPRKPTGANYVLCIRYRIGNLVTRFAFWTDDNAVMPNIPLYDGEVIPKNFVIEVWNLNGQTTVSNTSSTVVGLSLRKIVTDFSIAPADYDDSEPTIIPASSISVSLVAGPSLPTGIYVHYDSANIVTNPVSSWPDSSGNAKNLTQATGAFQPTLLAVNPGAGSFSAVDFDGVNDFLKTGAISKDATLYFVINQKSWTALDTILSFLASGTRRIRQVGDQPTLGYVASGTSPLFTVSDLPIGTWGILTVQLSVAGPNTIQIGAFTAASGATGQLSVLAVGADNDGSNAAAIQLLEIIGYDALHDAATQLQVRQYLANKYFGGGPLPMVFGANNQWLDNPGFPSLVPNATPPPPPVVPDVTPPVTPLQGLGDPLAGTVLGDPTTGKILG